MRAAVMRGEKLVVADLETPTPGVGEVLVKTLACGICGSDLHALKFGHQMVQATSETGGGMAMDLSRDVVMGHEFCAEILDYGPSTEQRFKPGTRVCSVPMTLHGGQVSSVGYSNDVPGGYAENMLLYEPLLLEVPNGLPTDMAALTEPMAVGYHAVQMANMSRDDVALVIGCGPVGLAVIVALKRRGIGPVIAADFSPARRHLAEQMGADIVVDPAETSPYESWRSIAGKSPDGELIPADVLSGNPVFREGVFFECVGVPGVLDQLMVGAQRGCRIVVVGVCMQQDHIRPLFGITKELNLQFVLAYTPEEFAQTLADIADGALDLSPLVTGRVGIEGVAAAFEELGDPEKHAKIMVDPQL